MQTPSNTDAEKAEHTKRILKTWNISGLDDVVGASLSPSLWSLSLLKSLDSVSIQIPNHTVVRGLLRAEITKRIGNTATNGFPHRPFLAAMDVDNVRKTQDDRKIDNGASSPKKGPAPIRTLPSVRTPSPKNPSYGLTDKRPARLPAPMTPTSLTTPSVSNEADRLGPHAPASSPSKKTTAAEAFKRKRDAMMAGLDEELKRQVKRVQLDFDLAHATVEKASFEKDFAEKQSMEAAQALARLPNESDRIAQLEDFRAFQNDVSKIRKKYANLLDNGKDALSAANATCGQRNVAQETSRTILESLAKRVQVEAAVMETDITKVKKALRLAQEEVAYHKAVVVSKKAELDAAEKEFDDIADENYALDELW